MRGAKATAVRAPGPTGLRHRTAVTPGRPNHRKAGYGRQLAVRSARAAGASWTQIGDALGTTKQSAWAAHNRWLSGATDT